MYDNVRVHMYIPVHAYYSILDYYSFQDTGREPARLTKCETLHSVTVCDEQLLVNAMRPRHVYCALIVYEL